MSTMHARTCRKCTPKICDDNTHASQCSVSASHPRAAAAHHASHCCVKTLITDCPLPPPPPPLPPAHHPSYPTTYFHDVNGLFSQLNAATELGLLVVTSFEENDRACDETRLAQLKRVAEAMTPGVEMSEFLKRAIRCDVEHVFESGLSIPPIDDSSSLSVITATPSDLKLLR